MMIKVLGVIILSLISLANAEINYAAVPFNLSQVTLTSGSLFNVMEERNIDYLLNLDSTRLACLYTAAANLTGTIVSPTCNSYPHQAYYGHYLGHWLSATALGYASTRNEAIRTKSAAMVNTLQNCQNAWTKAGFPGYLFPYNPVAFSNLENPPGNCKPVCVPFYVMHKVMAGLIDQYTLIGNTQAFTMVKAMGLWVKQNVESVLARGGERLWQEVLQTEWGGMNEALFNLYGLTGDTQYETAAYYFNHYTWTAPLAINIDDLSGNHANTHIPEVIGDARGYELSQNATEKAISQNFFDIILSAHSFSTGGSNDHEYWGAAHRLGDQMDSSTEESCTTYNILKLARHLYQWSANSSLFDFYERALFNGLIGNQNRLAPYGPNTHSTGFIYFLPLGGGGLRKPWGPSNGDAFPCCWGTLSETFSKLGDSLYFYSPDNSNLYINLFASSTLNWSQRGLRVVQTAGFPESTTSTTFISLSGNTAPGTFAINIRVPYWAVGTKTITVNGTPVSGSIVPGTYFSIRRSWSSGDVINVYFQPTLRFEQLNDNRPAWKGVGSIMYGALMLAAESNMDRLPGDINNLNSWIARTSNTELTFSAKTNYCNQAAVPLIPLMNIVNEAYAVYFHTAAAAPDVHYNPSGSIINGDGSSDFSLMSGAAIVANGNAENIRSGDPGQTTTVTWSTGAQDSTHSITGVAFSYRYVTGYGAAGRHTGVYISLTVSDECNSNSQTLYKSPELVNYPFDSCPTCYSPPVVVDLRGRLNIPATTQKDFSLVFQNNDRNVQLLLPMNITVYWS